MGELKEIEKLMCVRKDAVHTLWDEAAVVQIICDAAAMCVSKYLMIDVRGSMCEQK